MGVGHSQLTNYTGVDNLTTTRQCFMLVLLCVCLIVCVCDCVHVIVCVCDCVRVYDRMIVCLCDCVRVYV